METRKSVGYLKLPPEVHARVAQLAQDETRKMKDQVIVLIKLGLAVHESRKAGERDLGEIITQLQARVDSLESGDAPTRVKRRSRA